MSGVKDKKTIKAATAKTLRASNPKTLYSPALADEMCRLLSEGVPLREICRRGEGFPEWRTVYDWLARDEKLAAAVARARDIGYDNMAEECLQIADGAGNDWMEREGKDGANMGWVLNGDHVQRSKLRIETRLKLLACFNPKRYGNKVAVGGDAENPLQVKFIGDADDLLKKLRS